MAELFDRDDRLFLARWLRAPLRTGAVMPSSPALARLMAAQVDLGQPGNVIELGGGTGVITQALLDAGVEPGRLLVIERDEALHGLLTRRFPDLAVTLGDACEMRALAAARDMTEVGAVISSLPLLAMPDRVQWQILDQALGALTPGGIFVQYTYGPHRPIPRQLLVRHGCIARQAGFALLNLPPATVWRVTRPAARANVTPLRTRPAADAESRAVPAGFGS